LDKQIVFKQITDVNGIIDSTAQIYLPVAEQKGITLEIKNMDKELQGFVDIDMLKTVIRNLVSNALKFSYNGGIVTVDTQTKENEIVVSVKDTGKGMTNEEIDKLMNQNIHFTTYGTNNEKGSGLGLMLCKDFIKLHNGELRVVSEPNKGTTFSFTLPSGIE
jgi:two-component system sensor histidine kinase/response regulator